MKPPSCKRVSRIGFSCANYMTLKLYPVHRSSTICTPDVMTRPGTVFAVVIWPKNIHAGKVHQCVGVN